MKKRPALLRLNLFLFSSMTSCFIIVSIILLSAYVYADEDLSETLPQNYEIPLPEKCEDVLSNEDCNDLRALTVRLGLSFGHVMSELDNLFNLFTITGLPNTVYVGDIKRYLWKIFRKRGKRGAEPNMNNPFNKFLKKIFDKIGEFVKKTFRKRGTQPKELVTDLKTHIKDDLEKLKKSLASVNNDESTTDFQLDDTYTLLNEVYKRSVIDATL